MPKRFAGPPASCRGRVDGNSTGLFTLCPPVGLDCKQPALPGVGGFKRHTRKTGFAISLNRTAPAGTFTGQNCSPGTGAQSLTGQHRNPTCRKRQSWALLANKFGRGRSRIGRSQPKLAGIALALANFDRGRPTSLQNWWISPEIGWNRCRPRRFRPKFGRTRSRVGRDCPKLAEFAQELVESARNSRSVSPEMGQNPRKDRVGVNC